MIELTKAAQDYIKGVMHKRENCTGIKFGVTKSGCSGYGYQVDLAFENTEDLLRFENGQVCVYVDPKDLPLIDGTRIDFTKSGLNCRLVFNNPNIQGECGCGMSFSV